MFLKIPFAENPFAFLADVPFDLDRLLSSSYLYEQNYVKVIGAGGRPLEVFSMADVLCQSDRLVVKIEGFEKYDAAYFKACHEVARQLDHCGPVTAHLFVSPAGAASFPLHTDPDLVVLAMLQGEKVFSSHQEQVTLSAGEFMLIPRNYPHQAINSLGDNVMLSIGLESFTVEKL